MPPVFGNVLATSARASAPHIASRPPTTQTASMAPGPGSLLAIPAGDRNIPDPMVMPTTTVIAPNRPRRRGRLSFPVAVAGMCLWYTGTHLGASRAEVRMVAASGMVESSPETVHFSA